MRGAFAHECAACLPAASANRPPADRLLHRPRTQNAGCPLPSSVHPRPCSLSRAPPGLPQSLCPRWVACEPAWESAGRSDCACAAAQRLCGRRSCAGGRPGGQVQLSTSNSSSSYPPRSQAAPEPAGEHPEPGRRRVCVARVRPPARRVRRVQGECCSSLLYSAVCRVRTWLLPGGRPFQKAARGSEAGCAQSARRRHAPRNPPLTRARRTRGCGSLRRRWTRRRARAPAAPASTSSPSACGAGRRRTSCGCDEGQAWGRCDAQACLHMLPKPELALETQHLPAALPPAPRPLPV